MGAGERVVVEGAGGVIGGHLVRRLREHGAAHIRAVDAKKKAPAAVCRKVAEELERVCEADAPQGVRGRNSDDMLVRERLGWEPRVTLEQGLERTHRWIYDRLAGGRGRTASRAAAARPA